MTEPLYTLAEAVVVIAQQACQSQGHTAMLQEITPAEITCDRCGQKWTLTAVPAQ